ncbi:MAG: hypothetical protein ACRDSR_13240 [Pseudonocardiaceae bacterium]
MGGVDTTVRQVVEAPSWDQRIAQIRLIPQKHGTGEHPRIYAEIARRAYVPHLAPDFAYIHEAPFYERPYFAEVYAVVDEATDGFTRIDEAHLARVVQEDPRTLLVLRTILGLTKDEFAHSTAIVAEMLAVTKVTGTKVGTVEKDGTPLSDDQARLVAATIVRVMDGSLFGAPGGELRAKQHKLDTRAGWGSVESLHRNGLSYVDLLHQRHYGGAYRQVTDGTSTRRGDLIEDAVEQLLADAGVPCIRTGAHNQGDIADRFEIQVRPAPDFVVYDSAGVLRAILECKLVNDGGTARDKALRFARLRAESVRLGGIPLLAVLGGMGWARVNDTLGPVVRDTDGRVFTIATLPEMLTVAPFPTLLGLAS